MWVKILEKFVVYGLGGFLISWAVGTRWLSYEASKRRNERRQIHKRAKALTKQDRAKRLDPGCIEVVQKPKDPKDTEIRICEVRYDK